MAEIDAALATPEQIEAGRELDVPGPKPSSSVELGERGVMLRSLEDLLRFAATAVAAGLAPKGMNSKAAALAIQAGLERGLGPLGGLQALVVINGNLSWRGQAALALLRSSGKAIPGTLDSWTEGEGEDQVGVCVSQRVGYDRPFRTVFTVADARRANLWGKSGPWQQYPARQLKWRAVGFHARDHYSDVLGGFPLAEEAEDYEHGPRRGETPATRAQAGTVAPAAPDPFLSVVAAPETDGKEAQEALGCDVPCCTE
jgi:hypothetical protein